MPILAALIGATFAVLWGFVECVWLVVVFAVTLIQVAVAESDKRKRSARQ